MEGLKIESDDEKLRRYKSNCPQRAVKMNKMMPKTMFAYGQNELSRLGRPLKKLLGEAEIDLLSPNY